MTSARWGRGGRGFTLAEVLVVVVLLVMVFALAVPFVAARVRATAFLEAQERLEAVAMLARADAQRRGEGVRVCVREGALVEEAVVVTDWRALLGESGTSSTHETDKFEQVRPKNREVQRFRQLGVMELPEGVAFFETAEGAREAGAAGGASAAGAAGSPPVEVVIGVALPDGQFESAGARYMVGDGRMARLEVNRWTGAVTSTPVPLKDEEEEGAEEKPASPSGAPAPEGS